MTSRALSLSFTLLAVVALSACSAAAGSDEVSAGSGGSIEMAISETCPEGSESQCVTVNGESVVMPTAFERAGVVDSSVADRGQNVLDVTFDNEGAKVLHALTEEVAGAGESSRLVLKIGGELQAAVVVMEPLTGDQVQISLPPEDSAQKVVDRISGS